MKKQLLVLLLILVLPFILKAREYHPFPTKNTVWAEFFYPGGGHYPNMYHYFSLKDNDTIIKDNHYQKLYFSYDTIFTEDKLCGGLREENKRVYYYSIDTLTCLNRPMPVDSEVILYDFNLKLGDTITGPKFRVRNPGKLILNKIDSMFIDNEYRDVYTFGYPAGDIIKEAQWVEGIGCLRGLMADIGYIFNNDMKSDLICFIQDQNVLYHFYYYYNDQCYNKNPDAVQLIRSSSKIKIIPNPVCSSARIEFEKPDYQKLIISDQSGKKLMEYNLEGKQSIVIDKGELLDGLYLLSVYDKAGTIQTLKIIFK
jgi:hypothetical protein